MQDLAAAIIATAGKSILLYPQEMQPQPTKKPRTEPATAVTTRGHPTPEGLGLVTTAALATITANHTPAWHTLLEKSQAIPATLQVAVQDPVLMMQAALTLARTSNSPPSSTESVGKQGSAHHGLTLFMGGTHPVVHPANRQNTPTSDTHSRVHQTRDWAKKQETQTGTIHCSSLRPTNRQTQLLISGRTCNLHSGHLHRGERHGHGLRTTHEGRSSTAMSVLPGRIMPGSNGSNRWRWQDSHDLWWILGWCEFQDTKSDPGEDHGPNSPWRDCSDPLASCGIHHTPSGGLPQGSGGRCPRPWYLPFLELAYILGYLVPPEGTRHQSPSPHQGVTTGLAIPNRLSQDEWWINKVGTYGMASAQLYWGRLAALLLRLLYHLFPEVDWGFVFVDDFCWLLRTTDAPRLTAALLATLLALGTPLSWKKTFVGETNTWLGFVVNPREPSVMMARSKHLTVMALLTRLHEGHTFSSKEVEQALGRIQWATTCFPMTKVFLQPFWAWKVACKTAGRPPKVVRLLAKLLLFLFRCPNRQLSPYSTRTTWWGCSDASASKEGIVYVGGWLTDSRDPTKDSVHWFHTQVVAADVPWLFGSPDARRRIAAFELLGTYLLCSCLMDKCEPLYYSKDYTIGKWQPGQCVQPPQSEFEATSDGIDHHGAFG